MIFQGFRLIQMNHLDNIKGRHIWRSGKHGFDSQKKNMFVLVNCMFENVSDDTGLITRGVYQN